MATKGTSDPSTKHVDYDNALLDWTKIRDCIKGENWIKRKTEDYLPRPAGMSGIYESAYDAYIERAHFPLICTYALQGALGIVTAKLPEFVLPDKMKYLLEYATKDGFSIDHLFLNTIVEIFISGRCPMTVDIIPGINEFRFIQYEAENLTNWKTEDILTGKNLILGVLQEQVSDPNDVFSVDTEDQQKVLRLNPSGTYYVEEYTGTAEPVIKVPNYMGKESDVIPLWIAGSLGETYDIQPIPLSSVANCSIQIYRKEADLANSEFLSCNPTLVFTGVQNPDDMPNVVGSSVLIVLPDPQSRAFYTTTDTAALKHVSEHIDKLYEEAIRHGVAILESRKGVESAESLRIRQATQSASVYSIYLSALSVIKEGLYWIADMMEISRDEIKIDFPSSLTYDIPESNILKEAVEGFTKNVITLKVVHRYLVNTGLLDQTVSYEDYVKQLTEDAKLPFRQTAEDVSTTTRLLQGSLDEDGNIVENKGKPNAQNSNE